MGGITVGGANPGEGNLISGNGARAITLFGTSATGNSILGNRIGTNASGTTAIANASDGIFIGSGASNNTVGNAAGGGNVTAFNGGEGVQVDGATSEANSIRGNSIHSNGGLGIDLTNAGNLSVPAPTISSGSATTVSGSACPGCIVDVYSDDVDEGRHYLGSTTATLGGFWSLSLSSPPPAAKLTATATDNSSTSEFSAPFNSELCDGLDNDSDGLTDEGYPNADGDGRKDCVDSGQTAFYPPGHGHSAPTVDCSSLPEDLDSFKDGDGCPEPDNDNDAKPDSNDTCPGNDNVMGADLALGVGGDQNHNGIVDGGETWAPLGTSGNDDSVRTYEDYDGILDTDGCHDSPCDDVDGDSFGTLHLGCPLFADEREATLGTNAVRACAATPAENDEPVDPWPLDTDDDTFVDTADIASLTGRFGLPGTGANVRYDLNLSGFIDTGDIALMTNRFGGTCVPPGPLG